MKLAAVFSDHMVLQRDKTVYIWGQAAPGQTVHAEIQKQYGEDTVKADGSFCIGIGPLQTSWAEELAVICGDEKAVIRDVQVGEVWLAGGQSNMEYLMSHQQGIEEEQELLRRLGRKPELRFFDVPEISYPGEEEQYDYSPYGFWRTCTPEDIPYYSAVSYFFGRMLEAELGVPVGIIGCNWGGTPSCSWMRAETIHAVGGSVWIDEYLHDLDSMNVEEEAEKYKADPANNPLIPLNDPSFARVLYPGLTRDQQLAVMGLTPSAAAPKGTCHPWRPAGVYYTMLRTVIPYALRGIIYYQGESDDKHAELYSAMLSGLIRQWREDFRDDGLPFLMVQLAPFKEWMDCVGDRYPELRAEQQKTADTIPNVYLASNGDGGMYYDIHPKNKRPAGERLAKLALGHVYGKDNVCDAPRFSHAEWQGDTLVLHFDHAEILQYSTLRTQPDEKYYGGEDDPEPLATSPSALMAEIGGNTLRLTFADGTDHAKVKVRYAQTAYYKVNLYNEAGIPLLPFSWDGAAQEEASR
ncbi:MAG: hypothetical protein IJL53_08930 [Firmicutes bacterium]|nr:hypothetical protein [Bacillota bacterium]